MTIYIDSDYKCYVSAADGRRAVETDFFDGKCAEWIESFRYVPKGETWVREDGEALAALELVNETSDVDVEKIYQYIKPAAEKGAAPITLPIIGTLTFTAADVDSLYAYIMQA